MVLGENSFEDGRLLIHLLGTFWSSWFNDQTGLKNLMDGQGNLFYEAYLKLIEAFTSLAKATVPVHSLRNWRFFIFSESARTQSDRLKHEYGETDFSYGTSGISYGDLRTGTEKAYPLPDELESCSHFYNRLLDPSRVLTKDVDFWIDSDKRLICFSEDPLEDDLISVREVLDDGGAVTDRQFGLWAGNAEQDEEHIWKHFGYALGIWMRSSEFYRQFISALWDNLVIGSTKMGLKLSLSALTGVPIAEEGEQVEKILTGSILRIITSKNVYEFNSEASPLVTEGQVLAAGDILVDAFQILEPRPGDNYTVSALSLGPRFLGFSSVGPLYFENKSVALSYIGKDIEGRTIVRFDVKGWPTDVEAFWRSVHLEGIQSTTLARLLDLRAFAPTEPLPQDIPAEVNPLEIVMNNLFRNNLYIIRFKPECFNENAPGLSHIAHLREFLPPQTTFLIFVEFPERSDYYLTEDLSDEVDYGPGLDPMTDILDISGYQEQLLRDLGPLFKLTPEHCR